MTCPPPPTPRPTAGRNRPFRVRTRDLTLEGRTESVSGGVRGVRADTFRGRAATFRVRPDTICVTPGHPRTPPPEMFHVRVCPVSLRICPVSRPRGKSLSLAPRKPQHDPATPIDPNTTRALARQRYEVSGVMVMFRLPGAIENWRGVTVAEEKCSACRTWQVSPGHVSSTIDRPPDASE